MDNPADTDFPTASRHRFADFIDDMRQRHRDLVQRHEAGTNAILQLMRHYTEEDRRRTGRLGFENDDQSVRSRLASLEDRVLEVERRLNIPPAA